MRRLTVNHENLSVKLGLKGSTLKDPYCGWFQNTGEKNTTLKYLSFLTFFEAPHWPSYQTCFQNVKQEGVMERPLDKTGRLFSFKGNLITHFKSRFWSVLNPDHMSQRSKFSWTPPLPFNIIFKWHLNIILKDKGGVPQTFDL